MFKALLWKEWRETRLFFFTMALGAPCFSILLNILENRSDIITSANITVYGLILAFYTVLIGAIQFAGDDESGTSGFLMSRPIHWFRIWLFKVVYGSTSLILFILFLFTMANVFLSPLLKSGKLFHTLLEFIPEFTPFTNFNGILACIIIFTLYFISCAVSANIRSTLKSAIVTFIAALFLLFIMFCSFSAIYFKESYYLIFSVFPVLFFIVFIRYRPESRFTKTAYWLLSVGTTLIWALTAFKGGSLLRVLIDIRNFGNYFINALVILFAYLIPACFMAAVATSLFASGIFRKQYPAWWKSLSCLNFFILAAFSFSAVFIFITPSTPNTNFGYERHYGYDFLDTDKSNATFVIENSLTFKRNPSLKNKARQTTIGFSEKHFMLNRENGKVTFFGRGKFMNRGVLSVSPDQRWVIYSCPELNWGLYYTHTLWAENLDTSEQYPLMNLNNYISASDGKWFDGGKRFILVKIRRSLNEQSIALISVDSGKPRIIKKIPAYGEIYMTHIDKKERLYFYNYDSNLVSCYNRDLVKKYETAVIQEKINEFKSSIIKKHKNIDIYTASPLISPDGEFMAYTLRGSYRERDSKDKKQIRISINQGWCTHLANGESNRTGDFYFGGYYYRRGYAPWHPIIDNLWVYTQITESGDLEFHLVDMKKGTSKLLITEKGDFKWWKSNFDWSGNGKSLLTHINATNNRNMSANLYSFDSINLTCSTVSSKNNLWGSGLWSTGRFHVVFRSDGDKDICVLNLNTGKWSEIAVPFKHFKILGVSDKGEVFVAPTGETQIYRLTQKQQEIVFQEK